MPTPSSRHSRALFALLSIATGASLLPWQPAEAGTTPPSEGQALIWAGDRAWYAGERKLARAAYRQALAGDDPAATAMAHLRLLHFSGNLGMAIHGPQADEALRLCDDAPWCQLAHADYHLFAPPEVGATPAEARTLAAAVMEQLPGPALARLYLAGGDPAILQELATFERDGLGDGLVATGRAAPPGPGTWFLGIGFMGAPGLGLGGGLRWVHPDLGWREIQLAVEAAGTSRGTASLSAAMLTPGRWHLQSQAALFRTVYDVWSDEEELALLDSDANSDGPVPTSASYQGGRLDLCPGLALGKIVVRAGAGAAWYQDPELHLAFGPRAFLAVDERHGWGSDRRGWLAAVGIDSDLPALGSDFLLVDLRADLRLYLGVLGGSVLGLRLLGESAPSSHAPVYLLPSAGGAEVLRGAPAGRFRSEHLVAADVELRRMLAGPLEGVLFLDAAWLAPSANLAPEDEGLHPAGGAGLRLILPPRTLNVLRLDLAFSDVGWALSTGWGETF